MNTTYAVVRPDPEAWAAIPRSASAARQTVVAWLIVLVTTGVAFVVDSGWEDFASDELLGPYRMVDVFGDSAMMVAVLFALFGWWLGRLSVAAAPLLLFYAAVSITLGGYSSALIWWAGGVAATVWWLVQTEFTLRQIRVIRTLASESHIGATLELGPLAYRALRRAKRRDIAWATCLGIAAAVGWAIVLMVWPFIAGRIFSEEDRLFVAALGAAPVCVTVFALVQWNHIAWRSLARRRVGDLVWHVPVDGGPLDGLWVTLSVGAGRLTTEDAQASDLCGCVEESWRLDPDEPEWFRFDSGVLAAAYCAVHGIDVINSLSAEHFLSNAENTWLWDPHSLLPMPLPTVAASALVIAYAGDLFTGVIGRDYGGTAECYDGRDFLLEKSDRRAIESERRIPQRPEGGALDTIDLAPVGLGGYAVRYRHGRAWLDTSGDSCASD